MIDTITRNMMKDVMILGEAYARYFRQERAARLLEDEISTDEYENDVDVEKSGLSKYVSDKMSDLELDTSDYSLSVTTSADDELASIDLALYGNEEFIGNIFTKLKEVFKDVIVKNDRNESAGRVTNFHCFNSKK